ncbi:FGGY-family carbohydrate kinase [uncultured Sphaerochaeta sp.]|uniref:xylulokinase n=1 Tax=uncultured Sphaerochaeta sp. TaxID=886478 RepID=UPI002A0A4C82|nr:FGGY-family carbohydrate kinase [uncultured Sphaerochaeta sp.]
MENPLYVITYDVGTTGVKTCLFQLSSTLILVASSLCGYGLYLTGEGGVEQDPQEWWDAMCTTTRHILTETTIDPSLIKGISFCSQMQGLVLVDKEGKPVRRAMSYMDQRSVDELRKGMAHGIQIAGANVGKLLKSIAITGAVALSVKDPVWKYHWVKNNEPELFKKIYKWLDVKEYLICRMTGSFIMTEDSAFATLLYDIRSKQKRWSKSICNMLQVDMAHLPTIVQSTDNVGGVATQAAQELGLAAGTAVFGGGGDAAVTGLGAGAVLPGDSYIYMGTSGWLSTVVEKSIVDSSSMTAAIVSFQPGHFNYFSELETAGKCLEWVKDHLALDEINIYLKKTSVIESDESVCTNLYEYLSSTIKDMPAGSNGVIFTPWLHGNRCPFEDPNARGIFFNIGLDTGKTDMIRAVTEGVCFHMRWFLETQEKRVKTSNTIRFVGGGALSPVTCQILSDCLGRTIETIDNPQNVGAISAALLVGMGLGKLSTVQMASRMVPVTGTYYPNSDNKAIYDRNFHVFKQLYKANKKNFALMNQGRII